jgi:hypothetical protein
LKDVHAAAKTLGRNVLVRNATSPADLDAAFDEFTRQRIGAVTFAADATFNARRKQIIALAARERLPTSR